MLQILGIWAISRLSSIEIGRGEASLRRFGGILGTISTEIEGQKWKFKGSRAIPELCSVESGDGECLSHTHSHPSPIPIPLIHRNKLGQNLPILHRNK